MDAPRSSSTTVCIVDDEVGVAQMCADYLKPAYPVRTFNSALSALAEFDRGVYSPDIVITDIKMPKMDGIQFMNVLRGKQFHNSVILISGFAEKSHVLAAMEQGVVGVVEKPFDPAKLRALVEKAAAEIYRARLHEALLTRYGLMAQTALKLVGKNQDRYVSAENLLYEANVALHHNVDEIKHFLDQIKEENHFEDALDKLAHEIKQIIDLGKNVGIRPLSRS